jgi:uncharacterized protein (DUF1684 family)
MARSSREGVLAAGLFDRSRRGILAEGEEERGRRRGRLRILDVPVDRALRAALLLLLASACGDPGAAPAAADPAEVEASHRREVEAWRAEREAGLRKDDGWLTLAGLFWLSPGENTFGSDPGNDLVFPAGKAPAKAGVFRLEGREVTVEVEPGVPVSSDGRPVTRMVLASDVEGAPTVLALGPLSFSVIERGERIGVRLKDRESPVLAGFAGIESYPVSLAWRLEARFEPYDPPRRIRVPNVLGTPTEETCPGALVLARDGETFRLEPTGEPGEDLFLVFGDATNGRETYGGGRFLYAPWPKPGEPAVLDFNRAYNPPCVFTPYATCPLPPRQNRLPFPVEAGEKTWGDGAHPHAG